MIKTIINYTIFISFLYIGACTNDDEPCVGTNWYYDEDGDGVGLLDSAVFQCEQPESFVSNGIRGETDVTDPVETKVPFVFTYGEQKAFYNKQTSSPYGFYLYIPAEYDSTTTKKFPLLVYLHGLGERGRSDINPDELARARWNGPPMLINRGDWNVTNSMIVATPQTSDVWNADRLQRFIEFLTSNLNVDASRIYMTGLSMGANGCFNYVSIMGEDAYTAAIVPIAGWGDTATGNRFKNVAVWAFHGDQDDVIDVQSSIEMIDAINNAIPKNTAKLTIYSGVKHPSWAQTYDGSGIGKESSEYDSFNMSIYDWMYQFKK